MAEVVIARCAKVHGHGQVSPASASDGLGERDRARSEGGIGSVFSRIGRNSTGGSRPRVGAASARRLDTGDPCFFRSNVGW